MTAQLPNLAGVASKDLVEKIGTGSFAAAYINWSRTMNLLRTHAPGWMVDYEPTADGKLLHEAPVGGYLMIRFKHVDGTVTPALPQAVMDNRNKAIALEKITARDISDTQRRGMCMAAAMTFGLAYELWAKMPMESGYNAPTSEEAPKAAPKASPSSTKKASQEPPSTEAVAEVAKVSEATFRESALEQGIHTIAIDALVEITKDKLRGDFGKGLIVLAEKSAEELNAKYGPKQEADDQW